VLSSWEDFGKYNPNGKEDTPMSGYLWRATVRNVNRALKEVNAFAWEGDYRFAARLKLKEVWKAGWKQRWSSI